MEEKKRLYDMLVAKNAFTGTFEQFEAGYADPAKQAKLHAALSERKYVTTPLEQWQAKYFGPGEKKKPEAQQEEAPQVAASSPAPGLQSGTASRPTDEQRITILPPESQQPPVPRASPDELIASLMERPTAQLLYSYAVGTLGDERKIAEFGKRFAKEENKKPLNDLLFKLENIRAKPGDNAVKMAQAQREVALSMDRFARDTDYAVDYSGPLAAGFADQYAKTVSGMEKTNPAAYKQLMDDRVSQSALSKRMDEKDYRTMLDASGLRAAYGIGEEGAEGAQQLPPEFQEADLRMAIRSIENRDYSYAADNPAFVAKKKEEDAIQIAEMTARADQLRADRLAEFDGMIAAAKATLDRLPGVPADNKATRQIAALEKERGYLLNPAKQVADVYAAFGDEIKSAPGRTPLEKAQNHFQRLSQEQKDLWEVMSQGGAGEFAAEQVGQMFGGTNDVTLRYGEVTKQLKALAPVVALNEAAIKEDGFTDSFLPAFLGSMYGGVVEATSGMSRQEMSSNMLQAMQVAGIAEQDLQPKSLEMSKKRMEAYGLSDAAYYGDILGSSAGIALPLMVGGSVTAPLKVPRMAAGGSIIGRIIAPVVNTSLKAAKTGGTYELTGQVFQNQQDELNFASGFFGGIGSEVVGSAVNKMGARAVATLFGDKAPEALKTIGRFGALSLGSGTGETAEEFAQTITQIAQSSDTFEQFQRKVGEQFPDWSSAAKFAFTTMIMGTGMGAGNNIGEALGKSGQALVDALPADESVQVKTALQQLAEESIYATEEFAKMAEGFKGVYEKGVEEFAKPEDSGSAATSVEAPVEGYRQSVEPIGVTQEGIAAAASGIPQEQVAPAIETAQVKGMTQTEKADAFGEGVRITGMDVTKPLPQAEHMAMIEDMAANPEDYRGAQSSPVVYAIRVGAGLVDRSAAEPAAQAKTPAEDLRKSLEQIAEDDMGDIEILATGFSELFGEDMEIDIDAIMGVSGAKTQTEGDVAAEAAAEAAAKPKESKARTPTKPKKVDKPTSAVDDAKNEAIDPSPATEKAAEQRVEKIITDVENKLEAKKEPRPRQREVPAGKVLTEYVKTADGRYRLTEYKKDEKGNWLFRNAASTDTPLTQKKTFKRDWQPITNTPQARDHIEALAASPVRTDLKNAINELKAATASMFRLSAIEDPMERAKQQKRVIDAAINVGAQLVKVGVSDFNDWLDSMAQVTGDAIRKQPRLAELIFKESQKKAAAEQPTPEQEPTQQPEQKKEAPAPQPEARQEGAAEPRTEKPKKKKKKAKPTEGNAGATQTRESGVSRLLARYSRPGVVKTIADSSPVMYQVSDQRAAMAQAADEIEADGIEESFAKVVADPGYSDVLSAKYQLLIDTYGRMGDEAVRENDREALAEISARIRALEQVVSRKATLGGQFNAMLAMYQSISGAAAPYLSGLITEYNAAVLQTRRSGIPIQTLINNITKEINEAKRNMAGAIASDARVDGAVDGSRQNPPSEARKTIKEKRAEALAEVRAEMARLGGSFRTGIDPSALIPLAKLGYYTILDGAVTFTSWAAEMSRQVGLTKAQAQEVWEAEHEGMTLEAHAEAAVKAGAVSKTVAALSEPRKRQPSEKTKATAAFKDMIREVVTRHIASPDGRMLEQVLEQDAGLSSEDAAKVAGAVREATNERLGRFVRSRLDSVARGAANQAAEPRTATSKAADRAARKLAAEQKGRRVPDTDAAESYDAIRTVVADHAANPGQEPLQSKLESQAGLNPAEASRVAASVANATPEALEAFINGRQKSERKSKDPKPRRTKADIILDTLVDSPLATDDVLAALAKKLGIRPDLTPEQYMELQRLGAALRGTPAGSITQQNAAWELAGAIAPLVPVAWWRKGMDMWRSLAYFSLLQGITTHVKNLQSGLERFGMGNFTTVLNPAKWERAASVYRNMQGNASKKAQAAFLASPIAEVVFKIGAFNRGMRSGGRSFVSSLTTGQGINIYDEGISPDNLLKSRPFFENQKGVLNHGKWVGRMLTAEDAMLRGYYQDLEATSDIRFAMAREGATFGEAWNAIRTGMAWKGPAFDQALTQAEAEASAWEQASGKTMPETLVRSRARQIMKMQLMQQHGVDPKGPADVAAYNTFTLKRNGIFGKFAHLLNRFITMTPVTELFLRPLFPFVEIVANLCDGMVDAVPVYGLLRPMGLSPTGIVARFTKGESAKLGEPGSTLRAAQWERAFAGFWAFWFLAGMMLLGDDDEGRVIDYKGGKAADPDDRYKLYVAGIPTIDMRNYPSLLLSFEAVDKWRIMREDRTNTDSETKRAMFAILGSFAAIKDLSFLEAFSSLEKASKDVATILEQGGTDAGGNAAAHLAKALVKEWAGFYAAPLPTNWGMVRQVWQVYDPTRPATTDMGELLCYSLGISKLTNTKRVDMFGNITEGYPGNDIAAVNAMALPKSPEERRLYAFLDKHNVTLPAPINRSMVLIDESSPTGFVRRTKTPKEWEELLSKGGKLYKEMLSEYIGSEAADDAEMVKVTSAKTSELIPVRVSALRSAAFRQAEAEMFGDMLFESGVYEASELGF